MNVGSSGPVGAAWPCACSGVVLSKAAVHYAVLKSVLHSLFEEAQCAMTS